MHPNTLINEVAMVNALPIPQDQKDRIIKMMVDCARAVAEAMGGTPEQLKANLDALQKAVPSAVPGPGGVSARQTADALAKAAAYVVKEPTVVDKGNPTKYFYNEFTSAGFTDVSAPNGPVERAGAQYAVNGQDMKGAVEYVIDSYAAGTATIAGSMTDRTRADQANNAARASPTWANGPYAATACTPADKNYLHAVEGYYREHTGRDIWTDTLKGNAAQVQGAQASAGGAVDMNQFQQYKDAPGPLVAIVRDMLAKYEKGSGG